MLIGVIGDEDFNNYELLEEILLQDTITGIISGTGGKLGDNISRFARRHVIPSVHLSNVEKVVVFYGGTDTRLIGRMKKAQQLGKKIKLIKYNLL